MEQQVQYNFSYDWFGHIQPFWDILIPQFKPLKILEIGSFEGRSSTYIIDNCSKYGEIELFCIDTWEGSDEHAALNVGVSEIEDRFKQNVSLAIQNATNRVVLTMAKGTSYSMLSRMICENKYYNYFDLIYIDGSHYASDVLTDGCMSYNLLKEGGIMIFDDYRWDTSALSEDLRQDPWIPPQLGVDSFMRTFENKFSLIQFDDMDNPGEKIKNTYQIYLYKDSSGAKKIV
jgi:predicted O-methyltransferase YrrM